MERELRIFLRFLYVFSFVSLTGGTARVNGTRFGRFVLVNPYTNMQLGFLTNVPIALTLPSLRHKNWNSARSFGNFSSSSEFLPEFPDDLEMEHKFLRHTDSLQSYFGHLQIDSMTCQEKVLCEMSAEQGIYFPLSDLALREFRWDRNLGMPVKGSLMWRYLKSVRTGMTTGAEECRKAYSNCPASLSNVLDWPTMKTYTFLMSKLNLKLF